MKRVISKIKLMFFNGVWGPRLFLLPPPSVPFGGVISTVGTAANTDTGREVIATGIETYGECQMEVGLAELEGNQELGNAIGDALSDANDAFGDAVIDWVSSIDQDDPMVQLYGE